MQVRDLIASWLRIGSKMVLGLVRAFGMLHVGGALVHVWSIVGV